MIHFHQVSKGTNDNLILGNLTLFLPKASYTLLCGDRHSGKTTVVRLIMAYEAPDEGTLTVDDIDIGSIPESRIPYLRRQIGLIAESAALLEERTVSENITVPLQLAGFSPDVISQRVSAMLERTRLGNVQKEKVGGLSAATRQLVSTARAIIHKPPIVVADEPLHNLDDETAGLIVSLLNEANEYGATVLVTCQSETGLLGLGAASGKTLLLKAGSIIDDEYNTFNRDADI